MATLAESLAALNTNIDAALTKINTNIATLQTGKLDAANNFDPTGTGLVAVTLSAALKELKVLIDNLDATYGTDADIAAQVAAVNAAWQDADNDINTLITNIQNNYAALARR